MTTKLLGFAALAAAIALPTASFAQTFAYVNTSGEVTSIEATDAATALRTAPSISTHSGVLLLADDSDSILDDSVSMNSTGSMTSTGSSNMMSNMSTSGSTSGSSSSMNMSSSSSSMNMSSSTGSMTSSSTMHM